MDDPEMILEGALNYHLNDPYLLGRRAAEPAAHVGVLLPHLAEAADRGEVAAVGRRGSRGGGR